MRLRQQGIVVRDLSRLPGLPAAIRIGVAHEQITRRLAALLAETDPP
jgi:histidinol-phosphate/aromatic aminotransferase/cobyric acid decarboxylase-like protein